jgi:hypothetical protein
MIINEFINYLINKGFDEKQISQLVKIQEAGYNLTKCEDNETRNTIKIIEDKYIKPTDNIDKLRQLKDILIKDKYDNNQLTEILVGYCDNINYNIYSNIKFNSFQMYKIRYGLENGIDITKYCNETYNWMQMSEIIKGVELNIDVKQYLDIKYNCDQMEMLRIILVHNKINQDNQIDIKLFQNEKIPSNKIEELFEMLILNNQELKIEAYKQLEKYNKKENININNELEK